MMDGELIFMGIIMLVGQIILMQMWNANWFKKENFKIQKSNTMAENKIKLKKLEKDLGVTGGNYQKPEAGVIEQLKGIDIEKIKTGLNLIQKPEEEEEYIDVEVEGKPGILESALEYAEANPDKAKILIDKGLEILGDKVKNPGGNDIQGQV